eukprot:scaffold117801_cov46-Phaeocystis_antarctica.AAC.2
MVRVRARVRRQAVPGEHRYCPATIGTGARWWRLVGVKVRFRVGAYWGWVRSRARDGELDEDLDRLVRVRGK